jgi:rubrerythrin
MANIFSPQEVLRIAIKVEESGKEFYEALEEKAQDEKLKRMWRYLKGEEDAHTRVFLQLLQNVGTYLIHDFASDEHEAYLKSVSSGYVFTQELIKSKTRDGFRDQYEALDFGIYIEKESILVYSALRQYVAEHKQHVLDKVIEEEKNHLVQLTLLKETL